MPEPGWIDVAGGKLTTYRLMAEQTIDLIARHLNAMFAVLPDGQGAASGAGGCGLQRRASPGRLARGRGSTTAAMNGPSISTT